MVAAVWCLHRVASESCALCQSRVTMKGGQNCKESTLVFLVWILKIKCVVFLRRRGDGGAWTGLCGSQTPLAVQKPEVGDRCAG